MVNYINFFYQIMLCIGATFILTVLTLYTLYRYLITHNELIEQLFYVHVNWVALYLFFALVTIHVGSKVTRQV